MSKTWTQPPGGREVVSNEEKRINVLFSPFRKRELNPLDYDSKLAYWKEQIFKFSQDNRCPTFTISRLQKELSRNNKSPSCIPTVIDELLRVRDVMTLDSFLKINPEQSWGSWVVSSLVVTPAAWSFGKLLEALDLNRDQEQSYVSIQYLKSVGGDAVHKFERESKSVMTREDFVKRVFDGEASEETVDLLLHWLKIDKKCLVHKTEEGKELIKIGAGVKRFSESETVGVLLEDNRNRLLHTIETLEQEKKDSIELVRKQLREGNKILAKSTLRKSKELEKCIAKKCVALDNLDLLLVKIHETKSDSEVFNAYKLGLSALKEKLKESGLNEDIVSDTMSEIQEVAEMHDEIQSALMLPVSPNDESQLEDELSEILSQNEEKVKEDSFELNLPEVPTSPLPMQEKSTKKSALLEPVGFS